MTSSNNLREGRLWIDKLFEMINQEFKAQGTKYQVFPNFGTYCREQGNSKKRVFANVFVRACTVSALSIWPIWLHSVKAILTISSLTTSVLSMTPVDLSCERVSKALLSTDRVACLVFTEIAMPGCSR